MKILGGVLFGLCLLVATAMLHRGQPLGWDELEFFRATRWVAEGQVPFRDFWEHHTPLQWLVFAPVAWFADGPGASSVVLLRWVQAMLWVGTFALLLRIAKAAGISASARWLAMTLLLAAPAFLRHALEYRVDALGNFLFVAAIAWALDRPRWMGIGTLLSCAVLANMRMAPLVIVAAIVFWLKDRSSWRMAGGVAMTAAVFVGWLFALGAWHPFLEGVIRYNRASAHLLEVDTFFVTLLAPVWDRDLAAILLWICAAGGVLVGFRQNDVVRTLGILTLASVGGIAVMEVQYEYHFQATYLLMMPLAAFAIDRLVVRTRVATVAVAAVVCIATLLNLARLTDPAFGAEMEYQNAVMHEVHARTLPSETVWDASGYALQRKPAYRYWFLTTGVRALAATKKITPFDPIGQPPAAIVYGLRMQRWFEIFPATARHVVRHYVPLYRDLWIPGLTAALPPGGHSSWRAPRSGRYTIYASQTLLQHPWLTQPLRYAAIKGPDAPRYAIGLGKLPLVPEDVLSWTVNGQSISPLQRELTLAAGDRVDVASHASSTVGVLVVPGDVSVLCLGPPESFEF